MKRSKIIDEITYILDIEVGELDFPSISERILSKLEEYGMMMTTIEKSGNGLDVRQISYWEDESIYGKSIVEQLNKDIEALNGLKAVTMIIDEAKGINWENMINTKINPENGKIITVSTPTSGNVSGVK